MRRATSCSRPAGCAGRATEYPHVGSVVASLKGAERGLPPFAVLPGPIGSTGIDIPHGQSAGWLGSAYEPFHSGADPAALDFDPRSALDRARRFLDDDVRHESDACSGD